MSSTPRMILHGGPISPFVRKVGICIIEKGLDTQVDYVRSPTAMVKVNAELLPHNPLSKIPTLITTDGMALFDSDVICEYLDTLSPPLTLFTNDEARHWQVLRWNALGTGALDAAILWRFERNRPPDKQMEQVLQAYATKFEATLRLLEQEMPLLMRAPYGIGHIAIGCYLGYLDFRFADIDWRSAHPRCAAWFRDEFVQRVSTQRTVPYEKAPPPSIHPHLWKPV